MRPTRAATLTALAGGALIPPITSLFAPALSHAGAYTVAAGDEIAVHSNTGSTTCTLGYTYTAGGATTYGGVTAGHCTRGGGSAVSDHDSGGPPAPSPSPSTTPPIRFFSTTSR